VSKVMWCELEVVPMDMTIALLFKLMMLVKVDLLGTWIFIHIELQVIDMNVVLICIYHAILHV